MNLVVSFLPIILPFIFVVIMKMSAKKGMLLSFIIVGICAFLFWGMEVNAITASIIQGVHKAFGILIILFGAVILMNVLKLNGAIDRINLGFQNLTKDMRIQVVVIAYLFGALIEGVAGFGTPAVVVAPLLVALGFQPIAAATLALISNSVPVPFAAVGTPVGVGLSNVGSTTEFFNQVAQNITRIDFLAGVFMPTIVVFVLMLYFGKGSSKKDYLEILPWTIMIGVLYSLFASLYAHTIGYEFVTIGTSITMLIITTLSVKFKLLVPKNVWRKNCIEVEVNENVKMSLLRAWSPYILVIVILVLTRVVEPIKVFTKTHVDLSISSILGFNDISSSLNLLYSPGFILIIISIISVFLQKAKLKNIGKASITSLNSVKGAALALLPTLAMVQIFSNSAININDLTSMPIYLATFLGEYLNGIWIIMASFVGELGSFITGSATVSALTFSSIQFQIANSYNLDPDLIVSLGLLGGAAGNMICVHNVVSVSSVVGTIGKEGEIIKKTVIPALLYALLIGVAALILF
jgi:lactate permease